jgi:hypothetical protein
MSPFPGPAKDVKFPTYSEKAKVFFSYPYFYDGSSEVAALYESIRQEKFGELATTKVLLKLKTYAQVIDYFKSTGIHSVAVFPLCNARSIEDALDYEIVALNAKSEIDLVKSRSTNVGLPNPGHHVNEDPFFWVFGASGSGKTFYAVEQVAKFDMDKLRQRKYVTFYLKPFDVKGSKSEPNMEKLALWIKKAIAKEYGRFDRLEMHASIVLDDAHSSDRYFESNKNVIDLYWKLERFISSIRLVIVGARMKCQYGDCVQDVYLKPWSLNQVKTLACETTDKLDAAVVDKLLASPILNALSTDARSAGLLLGLLQTEYPFYESDPLNWPKDMSDRTPSLAVSVIESYINESGLKHLSDSARFRVAAWVLYAAKTNQRDQCKMPNFDGLTDENERNVAFSLISLNLVSYHRRFLQFAPASENVAVAVSPAMEVALLSVLRGPAKVVESYENGSAKPDISWSKFRLRVVAFVDGYVKREAHRLATTTDQARS